MQIVLMDEVLGDIVGFGPVEDGVGIVRNASSGVQIEAIYLHHAGDLVRCSLLGSADVLPVTSTGGTFSVSLEDHCPEYYEFIARKMREGKSLNEIR